MKVPLSGVPDVIRYLVEALPPKGAPMHPLRKRAFLRALSASLNLYYPDRKEKPAETCVIESGGRGDSAGCVASATTSESLPQ